MIYDDVDGICYVNIYPALDDTYVFGLDIFYQMILIFDAAQNKMAFWPLSEYSFVEQSVQNPT